MGNDFDKPFKKNKGLSELEANQFRKLLKDSEYKRKQRSGNKEELYSSFNLTEIKKYIQGTRNSILSSLNFNKEEKQAIRSLEENLGSKISRKIYYYFTFVTMDHKFFIEENVNLSEAVDGKLFFILGLDNSKQIAEESRKTVLFQLLSIIQEYSYHSYTTNSIHKLIEANELLTDLAVILSIASMDRQAIYSSNSLHLSCAIDPENPNRKFFYYISEKDAESKEFKNVYNFYFKHQGKQAVETILTQKQKRERGEKSQMMISNAYKNAGSAVGEIMDHYNDVLAQKLGTLKSKNDKSSK